MDTRNAKLLNRLGFVIEGYVKNSLLINHQWKNHILAAFSVKEWRSLKVHIRRKKIIDNFW
ncbi:hypothetical protein [Candidatus Protochlamydia sp. R18]|uniref:hypothetical protein n=1 Tax=Candidatus Protochlamydia sp. R18 TaxID=1353977 RepID=UPI0006934D48|nr:hypothetical protein [Candidatus Protochlamydia sp. R18]